MSAGQPPKYKDPVEMQKKIDEYFKTTSTPIISGLVYHLGFVSRQSFYDYEKNDKFSYTIKRARLRMEMSYEESLREKSRSGDIFALKNFGWKDTQNVDLNAKVESFTDWAKKVANEE